LQCRSSSFPAITTPREPLRAAFAGDGYLPADGFLQFAIDDYPVRLVALDTLVPGAGSGLLCGFVGKCQNSGREWASLIIAKISLIAQFNSLQGGNKFPVRMRRELARKGSDLMPIFGRGWRAAKPESMKFPVFSLLTRRRVALPFGKLRTRQVCFGSREGPHP
jgi:hypothetical protein